MEGARSRGERSVKPSKQFAVAVLGAGAIGAAAAALLPDAAARQAVLSAGALALGTQLPAHFLLRGWRRRNDRFVAAIVLGFAQRVVVLGAAAALFALPGRVAAMPFLLTLGVLLVAASILESCFEYLRGVRRATAVES